MNENREFARFNKKMKIEYSFLENSIVSNTCGKVINISLGGIYMATELLIDINLNLDLIFSLVRDDELIILKTTGTVLRSGTVISDYEVNKKYKLAPEDGGFYAVVKFIEPFLELSFMLH